MRFARRSTHRAESNRTRGHLASRADWNCRFFFLHSGSLSFGRAKGVALPSTSAPLAAGMAPPKRADSGPPPTPLTKEYLERITQKELCELCVKHGVGKGGRLLSATKESRILRLLAKEGVAVTGPIANWNDQGKAWQPPSKPYRKSWQRGADGKVSPSGEALLQRTFERYTKPPSAASLRAIAAVKAARAKAPPTRVTVSPELPAVLVGARPPAVRLRPKPRRCKGRGLAQGAKDVSVCLLVQRVSCRSRQ